MSKKLWVKFQSFNPVKVSTNDCEDISDFIRACKKELPKKLGSFVVDQHFLTTTVGGIPLEPDEGLPSTNTSKTPLYLDILKSNQNTSEQMPGV